MTTEHLNQLQVTLIDEMGYRNPDWHADITATAGDPSLEMVFYSTLSPAATQRPWKVPSTLICEASATGSSGVPGGDIRIFCRSTEALIMLYGHCDVTRRMVTVKLGFSPRDWENITLMASHHRTYDRDQFHRDIQGLLVDGQ